MVIILDADVIIRGEKGIFDLGTWLASRPDDLFEVTSITVAELWHGVERAKGTHKARRLHYLRAFLSALPVVPYTEQTAYEHARIWAQLEAAGKMIGSYDMIVAAMERAAVVATFNTRHFNVVPGLTTITPRS
jgi:tRNA(fMet)-specific endonuclease VapC